MKRPIDAIIDEVITEPTKIQPIIVQFQNGNLKDEEAKKLSCGLFHDQKKNKTVLGLSNGQVVYEGHKPEIDNELTTTMLVLHNKRTGKVRLIEAERWQVHPVLYKQVVNDKINSGTDKIALLNKQFGSKKVKRKTELGEKMKINVDSAKEEYEKSVSGIEISKDDLITLVSDEYITNTSLPACNREADTVKDVYNAYDIVPKDKLETLHTKATTILESKCEGKSQFFTQILSKIKSDANKIEKAAILLYIDATVKWLNTLMKDAKKCVVCEDSAEINKHIIDSYSVPSAQGRLRPNSMRDKAIIHCLILSLIISNFSLDLELFSTLLKGRLGLKKLLELSRIILAMPNKDNKKIVTLKLPLPAPVSIVKKMKKKQ